MLKKTTPLHQTIFLKTLLRNNLYFRPKIIMRKKGQFFHKLCPIFG